MSDLITRQTVRVRGRGQINTSISLFKAHPAPGSRKDHEARQKALAANALDAVGQPQTHSTPSGQPHKLTSKKGSLGE